MKARLLPLVTLIAVLTVVGLVLGTESDRDDPGASIDLPGLGDYTIGAPCVHDTLALYPLVSRNPTTSDTEFLTLGEALKSGVVKVHETKDVNRLSIRNRSDKHVFIQAGDIVRGGQQDRMASFDVVLAPRSGKVPLDAFCVEQGRWNRRGSETVDEFSSSENRAATKKLTLAARDAKSQGAVWNAVAEAQVKLAKSVDSEVRDQSSPTSMELTLESAPIKKAVKPFRESLDACVAKVDGAVGVAVAINGRLTGASLYAWPELFRKSWPKILAAASVEAVAAGPVKNKVAPPPPAAVGDYLYVPAEAKTEREAIQEGLTEQRRSHNGVVRFVTHDEQLGWVHAELLSERP